VQAERKNKKKHIFFVFEFFFVRHDSAIQASLMALAVPSVPEAPPI